MSQRDDMLSALRAWYRTHDEAPSRRTLYALAGISSYESAAAVLHSLRRDGLVVGYGHELRPVTAPRVDPQERIAVYETALRLIANGHYAAQPLAVATLSMFVS